MTPRLRIVLIALLLAACGRQHRGKFVIGFSQAGMGDARQEMMRDEVVTRAKDFPDLEILYAEAKQDNNTQIDDLEKFFNRKIDLLIIAPVDGKGIAPAVKQFYDAGIPVIVVDRELEDESYTTFVGADNRAIGRAAGEFADSVLGGHGNIIEIEGLSGSTLARDRSTGFREVVARSPGLHIIHNPVGNWLRDDARTQMDAALQRHPKIDLVYAHNDEMAIGAFLAAQAKGREKEMKFVGVDALPGANGGRQAVADGRLAATFVYPTGGKAAVETADQILRHELVMRRITLPSDRITR